MIRYPTLVYIHTTPIIQALELLAVLMVDGPEGYRAVLAAMDYFKLVKGERVRFYSLLDALMTDEADLAFKRDVMLFINTLVNRCAGGAALLFFYEGMKISNSAAVYTEWS